jgi:SAM-dependent methyltransferase
MPFAQYYDGHRDKRLFKAYDPQTNTKGREFMNETILPRFARFFKDGDLVYNIGQHIFWDYSIFFNNFERRCNYLSTDIDPTQGNPDIIDDIMETKLEPDSAEGVVYVGMSDVIPNQQKAIDNIYKILKPGGRLLLSFHGGGHGPIQNTNLIGVLDHIKAFKVDEMHFVYGPGGLNYGEMYTDGNVDSHFIIARKPKA